jgi:transforming growth factor-beta-induced protein
MRKLSLLLVIAALIIAALPSTPSFAQDKPTKTIADIVVESAGAKDKPEFTVLLAAVKAADPMFLQVLSDKDRSLTVFAPTDAAFQDLLKALNVSADDLLKNTALLNVVLAYHVVPGVALEAKTVAAANGAVVGTALPEHVLTIAAEGGKVMINKANVAAADVIAANGVVHVIDSVLVPEDAMELAKIVSDAMVATPDAMAAAPKSIAETVVAAAGDKAQPEFATLLAAVKAADPAVLKTLSNAGEYTVFAPTDAAFGAALKALNLTAEQLLADKSLTGILLYHVVPGHISAATLVAAIGESELKVVTLSGGLLTFTVKDGKVMINGSSTVVTTDIAASNGVVHVIDGVLLPSSN